MECNVFELNLGAPAGLFADVAPVPGLDSLAHSGTVGPRRFSRFFHWPSDGILVLTVYSSSVGVKSIDAFIPFG